MDIDIPGTIARWEPWRKRALLTATIILGGFSIWFIWFLAR